MAIHKPTPWIPSMSQIDYYNSIRNSNDWNINTNSYNISTEDMKHQIAKWQEEVDRREVYDRMEGPSRFELNNHESLNNAWSQYLVTRKLLGLK